MKDYNTTLPPIRLKAYGRHIQEIVAKVVKNPDSESKNMQAKALVNLMKRIKKDNNSKIDHEAQIWADLFAIANYDLDVETPYPVAKRNPASLPLYPMSYQKKGRYQRCFGRYFTDLIISAKKEIGKEEAKDEQIILALLRCAQIILKRESMTTIFHHIEQTVEKKITITPNIEYILNKKNAEKKKNYAIYRNAKKY